MTTSITLDQLVALNDEIASLVRAGVPLELGLRETGGDSAGKLRQISLALSTRMSDGASLVDAVRAEEPRLPVVYRTVVEAGLRAGRLPAALEALSNYARELVELRRKITLALIYPLIVTAVAYFLFIVVLVDLVERLRETYEMFRLPISWPLATGVWVAETASRWWWIPPACLAVAVGWWMMTGGVHILNFNGAARPLAWFPGVGLICRRFQLANFADLLALLVEHDVPLTEGLQLSSTTTGDERLRRSVQLFATSVAQGNAGRAAPFPRFGLPPFLYWVLTCKQQGAGLARLLRHAGSVYRRRAMTLAVWFKLIFPIISVLVIGGGVTALYAVALFGPLARFLGDMGIE